MTLTERATVFEQLGRMLKAGLNYHASLDTLERYHFSRRAREFVQSIKAGVGSSMGLAEALRGPAKGDALPMEVSIIDAGERGGRIDEACQFVARHYHVTAKTVAQMKAGFRVPVATLHVALAVWMLVSNLGESSGTVAGKVLVAWLWMWAGLAALWFGVKALLRKASVHAGLDAFLRRIPLLGAMRDQFALSRFARVCSVGLLAGLRMSETLRLAAAATQVPRLKAAGEAAAENVESGFDLTESFRMTNAFPAEFITQVAVAENTGDLDGTMDRQSTEAAEAAERSILRLAFIVPKVLYGLIAAFAVYVILQYYLGYFERLSNFKLE